MFKTSDDFMVIRNRHSYLIKRKRSLELIFNYKLNLFFLFTVD